jgi:hypothetical protein
MRTAWVVVMVAACACASGPVAGSSASSGGIGLCAPGECGPALGMPNGICPDGTISGPTGRCLRNATGQCGWEILACGEHMACGGIAGLPCPSPLVCVDDPTDTCDPALGGADCAGICVPPP